jgi:hypothetical protein
MEALEGHKILAVNLFYGSGSLIGIVGFHVLQQKVETEQGLKICGLDVCGDFGVITRVCWGVF